MSERFFSNPEAILCTLARLFAADGAAREVAILAHSTPELETIGYDNWDGGQTFYCLHLNLPLVLYTQVKTDVETIEKAIQKRLQILVKQYPSDHVDIVSINPAVVEDPQWREKAQSWLAGNKISNQGRVRSDNVAPHSVDGLLFRSRPEINLYHALKSMGVSFSPLPVFIRGGDSYQSKEWSLIS